MSPVAAAHRERTRAGSSTNGASRSNGVPNPADAVWTDQAFPQYLQKQQGDGPCSSWEEALSGGEGADRRHATNDGAIWNIVRCALIAAARTPHTPPFAAATTAAAAAVSPPAHMLHSPAHALSRLPTHRRFLRKEAEKDAAAEPLLSSFLYASILSHDSFERSLAFVLSNRLADATLMSTELFEVFYTVLRSDARISGAALEDLCAVRQRVRRRGAMGCRVQGLWLGSRAGSGSRPRTAPGPQHRAPAAWRRRTCGGGGSSRAARGQGRRGAAESSTMQGGEA